MKKYLFTIIFLIITGSLWYYSHLPKKIGGGELTAVSYTNGKAAFLKTAGDRKVIVGDKTSDTFVPEVTLTKWDEVSLKVKFDGSKIKKKTIFGSLFGASESVKTETDKIVYTDGINDVKYYEIATSTDYPEGAYEMEVDLNEKPDTNVMSFQIETQGLEFFYQPELTQEEKDRGSGRPDNVIGSYAVYYKDAPPNIVGGKEYKTGKAFHLYRPKVIDSAGAWVWGELNIDEKAGLLTVTIPQDFLDKAVYPVRHAAGLTFGYTTAGASYVTMSANYGYASIFQSPSDASAVSDIIIYNWDKLAQGYYLKGFVTLASTLSIISGGVGSQVSAGAQSWSISSYGSPPSISASTNYTLSVISDGTPRLYYDTGTTGQGLTDSTNSYTTPQGLSGSATDTKKYSIYATYTASGGGGTTPPPQSQNIIMFE